MLFLHRYKSNLLSYSFFLYSGSPILPPLGQSYRLQFHDVQSLSSRYKLSISSTNSRGNQLPSKNMQLPCRILSNCACVCVHVAVFFLFLFFLYCFLLHCTSGNTIRLTSRAYHTSYMFPAARNRLLEKKTLLRCLPV